MAEFRVSDNTGLMDALLKAQAGDKILLAGGNYGDLKISSRNFSGEVSIESADPNNKAKFDSLTMKASSNIKFKSVELGRPLRVGEALHFTMALINNSSNITLESIHMRGSMDGTPGNDGNGLGVADSSNIKVLNSTFEQLGRGIMISKTNGILISGNVLHDLRSDGMDFGQVTNVKIENNKIYDIFPADGDHPDAIQFFTTGSTASSTDIEIRNNQIFQGKGRSAQGIFLRNADGTLPFERVKIENNLLYAHDGFNGITVINGKQIEILGNTSLSETSDRENYWVRVENVTGGTVSKNVADSIISVNNTNLAVSNNIFLATNSSYTSSIKGLNLLTAVTPESLIISGFGYQLPTGTTTTTPVQTPTPAPVPATKPDAAPAPTPTTGGGTTGGTTTTTVTTTPKTTTNNKKKSSTTLRLAAVVGSPIADATFVQSSAADINGSGAIVPASVLPVSTAVTPAVSSVAAVAPAQAPVVQTASAPVTVASVQAASPIAAVPVAAAPAESFDFSGWSYAFDVSAFLPKTLATPAAQAAVAPKVAAPVAAPVVQAAQPTATVPNLAFQASNFPAQTAGNLQRTVSSFNLNALQGFLFG